MLLNEKGERCCCTHSLPVTERVGGLVGQRSAKRSRGGGGDGGG